MELIESTHDWNEDLYLDILYLDILSIYVNKARERGDFSKETL